MFNLPLPDKMKLRMGRGEGIKEKRRTEMERMKKIAKGTGKVILAILAGAFMPVLIWVALGVVLYKKAQERKQEEVAAPTIGEILTKAGLTMHR